MTSGAAILFDLNDKSGERVFVVARHYFEKYATQLNVKVGSNHGDAHNIWISHAKFLMHVVSQRLTLSKPRNASFAKYQRGTHMCRL